jgi:hypothetical protein
MSRIQIPVMMLEFDTDGNTIWIHNDKGATVLRIKTGGFIVNQECENICSHSDIIVKEKVSMCLADDAQQ